MGSAHTKECLSNIVRPSEKMKVELDVICSSVKAFIEIDGGTNSYFESDEFSESKQKLGDAIGGENGVQTVVENILNCKKCQTTFTKEDRELLNRFLSSCRNVSNGLRRLTNLRNLESFLKVINAESKNLVEISSLMVKYEIFENVSMVVTLAKRYSWFSKILKPIGLGLGFVAAGCQMAKLPGADGFDVAVKCINLVLGIAEPVANHLSADDNAAQALENFPTQKNFDEVAKALKKIMPATTTANASTETENQ